MAISNPIRREALYLDIVLVVITHLANPSPGNGAMGQGWKATLLYAFLSILAPTG